MQAIVQCGIGPGKSPTMVQILTASSRPEMFQRIDYYSEAETTAYKVQGKSEL